MTATAKPNDTKKGNPERDPKDKESKDKPEKGEGREGREGKEGKEGEGKPKVSAGPQAGITPMSEGIAPLVGSGPGSGVPQMVSPLDAGTILAPVVPEAIRTAIPSVRADTYGIGRRYDLTLAILKAAPADGQLQLDTMPPGAIVQLVRIKLNQALAGAGTAGTVQVKDGADTPHNFGGAFNLMTADVNSTAALQTTQLSSNNEGNFSKPTPLFAALSATGGQLANATAGSVSIWVRYVLLA